MSDREQKEITTPNGIKAVIKTYLTGREYREIENVFLRQAKVNVAGQASGDFDGSVVKQAEDQLIQQAVISLDGSSENILERFLDLRNEDFSFLVGQLNEMRYGDLPDKKKLPS